MFGTLVILIIKTLKVQYDKIVELVQKTIIMQIIIKNLNKKNHILNIALDNSKNYLSKATAFLKE